CVGGSGSAAATGGTAIATPLDDERARERALIARAQAGERSAFEELYQRHVGRVFALCCRLAGDGLRAEELAQGGFVRAWQKLHTFRGDSAFSSWLHPLAVNAALSERRAMRRRTARVFATDDLEVFDRPARPTGREVRLDLQQALQGLPPGGAAVFVLHAVEGYKNRGRRGGRRAPPRGSVPGHGGCWPRRWDDELRRGRLPSRRLRRRGAVGGRVPGGRAAPGHLRGLRAP